MPNYRSISILIRALPALAILVSCGPAAPDPRAAAAPSGDGAQAAGRPSGVSALDVCATVPPAELAAVFASDPATVSADSTRGSFASDCTYTLVRTGATERAVLYAYPAELWMPAERGLSERVSGVGDETYRSQIGAFHRVDVLLRGRFYLDVRATIRERALAPAELAAVRLDYGDRE